MQYLAMIAVAGLLGTWRAEAEERNFTNTDGKTVKAELLSVEEESAVMKLSSGRTAKVPLKTLSKEDQSFIAEWWNNNKDKLQPTHVQLVINKKEERIERTTRTASDSGEIVEKGDGFVAKRAVSDFRFAGELTSRIRRDASDILVDYTIYKRTSKKYGSHSQIKVDKITGNTSIRLLKALEGATFETNPVRCEGTSRTGEGGVNDSRKEEEVIGIVVTLSSGGKTFLVQSHPDKFLDTIKAEEEAKKSKPGEDLKLKEQARQRDRAKRLKQREEARQKE